MAENYFDYMSIVSLHELTDYDRRNHTNIIDIKHLGEHEKDIVVSEREAYYYMHSKYPKTYPLDLNKSIQLLPHFQDLKKRMVYRTQSGYLSLLIVVLSTAN